MIIKLFFSVLFLSLIGTNGQQRAMDESSSYISKSTVDYGEKNPVNNPRHLALVAGSASHDTGQHEHRAGVIIMERCLADVQGLEVSTHFEGWPDDEGVYDTADAILYFMDGGGGHPLVQENRLELVQNYIDEGLSLGAMHYGVEVPKNNGGEQLMEWIGGYYETNYSANPIWEAKFNNLPNHPITKGVQPFTVEDEWYFSIRFRPDMVGVTPLLVSVPSDETRDGPYVSPHGPYDHIVERKGESEVMSWAVERKDGGRGFGFTGGHFHRNWGNDDYRRFILNALVWLSGADIPENGVTCEVTEAELEANLDH